MTERILIWTAQMAKHKKVKALGVRFLDITAMSGIKHFAPEMRNVRLYKSGAMSEEEYTRLYIEKMHRSMREHTAYWEDLRYDSKIVVACYCRAGQFCHRHLFVKLLREYMRERDVWVIYAGEFHQDSDLLREPPVVKYPKTLFEVGELSLKEKVATFLVASYAYYILNSNLLPDEVYDFICKSLLREWDQLDEGDKKRLDKGSLEAGTYYSRKVSDYPDWVVMEATVMGGC